jgi:SAM-dependent methyltransferase
MKRPAIETLNRRAYAGRVALQTYRQERGLSAAERAILEKIRPRLAGKRLLDIGVGGGRTTPYLLSLSSDYFAIDYSPSLVELTRSRFALDSVYCCDVRRMDRFADRSFDFVLFSFNGIDYMSHEDRLKALGEIGRVLAPGGLFLFSSHNRNLLHQPGTMANRFNRRPAMRSFRRRLRALLLAPRHWRMRRHEIRTDEYAIVNDSGLHYSLLTYYVSPYYQLKQFAITGFTVEGVYDTMGNGATNEDLSPWIHYLVSRRVTVQNQM